MSINHDLPAPPLLPERREEIAEQWLNAANQLQRGPIDISAIVTEAKMQVVTLSPAKMADNEAFARPQVNTIFVRDGFRDEVIRKRPETLFKLAHEFSHLVLHRGELAKPLKLDGNVPLAWKPPEERQEDQAWDLARSIMLPRMHIRGPEEVAAIAQEFHAPSSHVIARLAQLRRERSKLRKPCDDLPTAARIVWENAGIHPEYDRHFTRLSKSGLRVDALSYNRLSEPFGWYIICGNIYSRAEMDMW